MAFWKRQAKPDLKCVNGIDAECEILCDIVDDPIFKSFVEDLVPIINLNYVPPFDQMDEDQLLMQQRLILANLVSKMIYK